MVVRNDTYVYIYRDMYAYIYIFIYLFVYPYIYNAGFDHWRFAGLFL